MIEIRKIRAAVAAILFAAAMTAVAAPEDKVDINTASEKELEALPGVGAATARKIIAGRPYSSVSALSKAGVSDATIQKISGLVKAGRSRSAEAAPAAPPARREEATRTGEAPTDRRDAPRSGASSSSPSSSSTSTVDLNTASQKDLEALPGVGAVTAKKIIAGRPYSSVSDLSRAGVSASTISKISPMVTAGGPGGRGASPSDSRRGSGSMETRSTSAAPSSASSSSSSSSSASSPEPSSRPSGSAANRSGSSAPSAEYQVPPGPGMVWVNLETKVYHREGDRWYGRTKKGRYMSESDAMKAGYRVSKEKGEPQSK